MGGPDYDSVVKEVENVPLDQQNEAMLDLPGFARKMGVSVNTVRNWIEAGKLVAGVHFVKYGRYYGFPWGPELLSKIMKHWHPEQSPPRPPLKSRRGNRGHLRFKA